MDGSNDLSKILGSHGAPHHFKHKDKVYTFRLFDQLMKDTFQKRLFEKGKDAAFLLSDKLTDEQLDRLLDRLTNRYMRGEFSLFSTLGQETIAQPDGKIFVVSLLSGCTEEEAFEMICSRGVELGYVLDMIIKESFAGLEKKTLPSGKDDPAVPPPENLDPKGK